MSARTVARRVRSSRAVASRARVRRRQGGVQTTSRSPRRTARTPAIDPELKPLEKKLKKPPFSSWNTFKQLSSGTSSLTKNKAETLKLKQGAATLMLRDRTEKRVELTDHDRRRRAASACSTAKPAFKVGDWLCRRARTPAMTGTSSP